MNNFLKDTFQITKRNLIKYKRVPELLVFSSFQPIMFLLLFNYVFGGAVTGGQGNYIDFLIPGIIIQSSIFGSTQTGIGLAEDFSKGIIDRFKTLPISRAAVLAGRTLADLLRNLFVITNMIIVGFILGFDPELNPITFLSAIALTLVVGYSFSWISASIGTRLRDIETAQVAGFIWVFPIVFVSSIFVPVETMPDLLQTLADINPVTLSTNAARELLINAKFTTDVIYTLFWVLGITSVFGFLSVRAYRRD